jgi:type II secretory pathway pseudopilin PulG
MTISSGHPARAPARRQSGISLLEVVIGVIIISFAGSILMVSSRTSVTGQLRSKIYGDAATATKEAIENIQLLPLDSVTRLSSSPMEHTQGSTVTVKATARGVVPADVSNFAALDTSTLRYVTLQTRFKNKAGNTATKTFTTIIYKP